MAVVVGIDVGGKKKGLHLVALRDHEIVERTTFVDAHKAARWCREVDANVVAVDAPSQWSLDGRARVAEKQLMARRVFCFATPLEQSAREHPKNHFDWMFRGHDLYQALEGAGLPLSKSSDTTQYVAIETFPHAAASALLDEVLLAKHKRHDRRIALERAGVTGDVRGMDFLDAAVCAVVAQRFLASEVHRFGSVEDGFIVVPKSTLWHESCA